MIIYQIWNIFYYILHIYKRWVMDEECVEEMKRKRKRKLTEESEHMQAIV